MFEPLILAVETALQNGSLSLLRGDTEISSFTTERNVSRAEDLLSSIADLLKNNNLKLREIDWIAVSLGPGSFTGIRIGIATARGLGFGADCPVYGISVLEALAFHAKETSAFSIVPTGRNQVAWQKIALPGDSFENKRGNPRIESLDNFIEFVQNINLTESIIIAESSVYKEIKELNFKSIKLINASDNAAKLIGHYSYHLFELKTLNNFKDATPNYLMEAEIGRK